MPATRRRPSEHCSGHDGENKLDLRREVYALNLACRDPRTPWYAKFVGVGIVAYALSPVDLIPDFIPVVGYLDEILLIPIGLRLVRALIPEAVMADCRLRTEIAFSRDKPTSRLGVAIVVMLWIMVAIATVLLALWL